MSTIEERIEKHKQLAMDAEKRYTFHNKAIIKLEANKAKQKKKVE